MKISILIPAFNEEKFIKPTLQALLAQDYSPFEIIVIDNGSTDKTADIARSMGVTVVHEEKKGTMAACECGRRLATGDIIFRIDADCIAPSNHLSRAAKHFARPDIVGVGGPYDYFDGSFVFRHFSTLFQKLLYPPTNYLFQKMKKGAIFIGGNSFMRASILEEIGGFNTNIVFYGDDTDTAKRMAQKGTILFNTQLPVKSSARRFKAQGTLTLTYLYILHFCKITFARMHH
jgi:glycosyltransferase involved in cell wall biosynthesis